MNILLAQDDGPGTEEQLRGLAPSDPAQDSDMSRDTTCCRARAGSPPSEF